MKNCVLNGVLEDREHRSGRLFPLLMASKHRIRVTGVQSGFRSWPKINPMIRRVLLILSLLILTPKAFAQTAELFVFEPGLERVVGYGTVVSGGEFRLTLNTYQGPVTALWVREGQPPASFFGTVSAGKLRLNATGDRSLEVEEFLSNRGVNARVVVNLTGNRDPVPNNRGGNSGSGNSGSGNSGNNGNGGNSGSGNGGNSGGGNSGSGGGGKGEGGNGGSGGGKGEGGGGKGEGGGGKGEGGSGGGNGGGGGGKK